MQTLIDSVVCVKVIHMRYCSSSNSNSSDRWVHIGAAVIGEEKATEDDEKISEINALEEKQTKNDEKTRRNEYEKMNFSQKSM